jgi:polysaccharide pyruvyl transferase WcaK-like protein
MGSSEFGRKIGIFSHGGVKNLGDEALFAAVLQNVRARIPNVEIVGFTSNPEDTKERHGLESFPIRRLDGKARGEAQQGSAAGAETQASSLQTPAPVPKGWKQILKSVPGVAAAVRGVRSALHVLRNALLEPKFLWSSWRNLRGVEILLIAGSQQLNDIYGAWEFPFTLYKWSVLARLTGTKVAILSVGAGPLSSKMSRFFIRRVLRMSSYRSYRDVISSRLVESIGVKGPNPVYPDLVYSMRLPVPRPVSASAKAVVVGVNPVPFYDGRYWATPNPERYADYVRKLAKFTEWLDQNGYSTLFFPTQTRADTLTIQDIRSELNGTAGSLRILQGNPIQSIDDLLSEIARADLVIANRYHGILLSLALNKPVLGVAYHAKSRELLEQAGQGDYVLNVADFRTEDLIEKIKAMHANAAQIKKEIASRIAPLHEALEEQYDQVFSLIGVVPSRPQEN